VNPNATHDELRREIYEIAETIAPTWERRSADIEEVAAPVREWMLRELRANEGDTLLELAAGVGETGFEAAAIVGASGRLTTTDLSPAMLEAARRRGAELGVKMSTTARPTPSESSSTTTPSTGCSAGSGSC
jgi:ubiquinone/menaquinone biosynthesis C-methylase UbiE